MNQTKPPTPPAIRRFAGRPLHYDDRGRDLAHSIEVAVESPLNLVYGDMPYAVMMATPADIEDFAIGFSLTEGVIGAMAEIREVEIARQNEGVLVSVRLTPEALRRHMARRRNLSGRTSCGLCGVENLDQIVSASQPVRPARLQGAAIDKARRALEAGQPLFRATRATHAAAWCDAEGAVLHVREDVGRHNALDKLIGACLRARQEVAGGFMVITSRCSFEMVEKAAIFGASALVAVSAPTSLAIERAKALNLTLIGVTRHDGAIDFTSQD